jgi:hypothetical protein
LPARGSGAYASGDVTPEPSNSLLVHAPERRQAVWPWLLMPLVALMLFIALYSVRENELRRADAPSTAVPAQTGTPED